MRFESEWNDSVTDGKKMTIRRGRSAKRTALKSFFQLGHSFALVKVNGALPLRVKRVIFGGGRSVSRCDTSIGRETAH